jgi:LysM repeat protein
MNRSTILLIALLLILGAIVLFLLPSDKEREISDTAPDVALRIDSASVVKLEIQHAPKLILLENIGGKWMVTAPARYQADPSAVTRLIGGLSKFKVGSLISSNPEKQHLFQVDTGGTHIIVTERSGKTTNLIIGKMGPSFSEVYFRQPTSQDVYLGEGIDSWSVNKDLKEWRDKTIFAQPAEAIRAVTFVAEGKQHDFHRDSTGWKSGDKIIETRDINPLLNTLANLRADDFVDTAMKFQSQPITISVEGAENVSLSLYPVPPDSSKYIVQTSTSSQLFAVGKYTARQLMNPIEHGVPGKVTSSVSAPPVVMKQPEKKPEVKKEVEKTPPVVAKSQEKTSPPSVIPKKESAPPPPVVDVKPSKKSSDKQTSTPITTKSKTTTPVQEQAPPPATSKTNAGKSGASGDDEGELTVHTVKRGETMQSIARNYGVTVEQILKWNLLKSIAVKPGQELYVYIRK